MNKNLGEMDRKIRGFIFAPILLVVAWVFGFATLGGVISIVLAAVMAGTAAAGFCPLYVPLHLSTRPAGSGH